MGWVYLVVSLFFLGAGGYGVWTYNSAIKENERLQGEVKSAAEGQDRLREAIGGMEKTLISTQRLASARASRAVAAEEAAGRLRQSLEELKNADKPSKDWADSAIPNGIKQLREQGFFVPRKAPEVPSSTNVTNPYPGTGESNNYQSGASGRSRGPSS